MHHRHHGLPHLGQQHEGAHGARDPLRHDPRQAARALAEEGRAQGGVQGAPTAWTTCRLHTHARTDGTAKRQCTSHEGGRACSITVS